MKYVILLLLTSSTLYAQTAEKYLLVGANMNSYKGDMGSFDQWNGGLQLGVRFNKKKRLNGSIHLIFGAISDQQAALEPNQQSQFVGPNNYFKSNFFSINYEAHYNLIKSSKWLVYIGQGIGFIRYTPKDEFGQKLEEQPLTRAEQETYRSTSLMLPTSIGATYFLSNGMGLALQTTLSNPLTDYLDNISELGSSGNDNILSTRFSLLFPLNTINEN